MLSMQDMLRDFGYLLYRAFEGIRCYKLKSIGIFEWISTGFMLSIADYTVVN